MTDTEKLAALLVRILGSILAGRVLLGLILPQLAVVFGGPSRSYGSSVLAANLFYLALAVVLVIASKRLGKLLGRGLN